METIPTSPWYYLYDSVHLPRLERIIRDQTALWMLHWLQHEGVFSSRLFHLMGNADHVRMRTVVNIVKNDCNEICELVEGRANHAWEEMLGVHN
ncbi:hypothetical protein PIB30_062010 [Stylosanthes scabra]|uniref:Uncharacterized protein n=1 Tax=Stylosanthes scabra TaxID=79078 RepID=A0ABU6QLD0_9FABA|nr:hypothetical protein [Stylosanthes scabra]